MGCFDFGSLKCQDFRGCFLTAYAAHHGLDAGPFSTRSHRIESGNGGSERFANLLRFFSSVWYGTCQITKTLALTGHEKKHSQSGCC